MVPRRAAGARLEPAAVDPDHDRQPAVRRPGRTSFPAFHNFNATVRGLKSFPSNDRPPVLVTFVSFRLMVLLGFLFVLLALLAVIFSQKNTLEKRRWFLHIMPFAIALPYLASELGWIVTEIGRQPWIVYGLLRTAHAASRAITPGDVLSSLIGFAVIYSLLAIADLFLLTKYARKIPA